MALDEDVNSDNSSTTAVDVDLNAGDPYAMIPYEDLKPEDPSNKADVKPDCVLEPAVTVCRKEPYRQPVNNRAITILDPFPPLPENFEEETWTKVKSAISEIFLKKEAALDSLHCLPLIESIRDVSQLEMGASRLHARIVDECKSHIAAELECLVRYQTLDSEAFLCCVDTCWQAHSDQMRLINRIMDSCLNPSIVEGKPTPKLPKMWDMGLQLFREHLFRSPEVEDGIVTPLLRMVDKERSGESVDSTLLDHLLKMFDSLEIYPERFEKPFLEHTSKFYAAEGMKYMQHSDVPDYLKHVETRLHEEQERCSNYLNASTGKSLVAIAEKNLMDFYISAILDKGFTMLMDGDCIEDLQRMYALFSRVNALQSLREALRSHILSKGQGMNMDEDKYEEMDRPAELIAKFLDKKLRVGNKGTSEEQVEDTLDKVLVFLRFIQGKDLFQEFYIRDLAKRLIRGKSAFVDTEMSMISKLKTEFGNEFTRKCEVMFEDIELSKEIKESFKQSFQPSTELATGIRMKVDVLDKRKWPTYPHVDVKLPRELIEGQDIFKEFYHRRHKDRDLTWLNSFGQCVLKAAFPDGEKELETSLCQAVVLMLFNDGEAQSFQDIKDSAGIEDKELRRTLQSLACGKVRVLNKIPRGRDVEDGDLFEYNDKFTDKRCRVKLNAFKMMETVEERNMVHERVNEDHKHQIRAGIVRIMKHSKELSHTLLVNELHQQLKFPPKVADVKTQIEYLLEGEYIERDKNDRETYRYVD